MRLGLAAESDSDALGEPHHGYAGISCTCDGAADPGDVDAKAVRSHKATDLKNNDEEHYWTLYLPTDCYLQHPVCRSQLFSFYPSVHISVRMYVGRATDLRFTSHGWALLRSGLGQATYTCASITKQYNLIPAKGGDLFGWKSNYGPGEK